jgi:hypothetical protein
MSMIDPVAAREARKARPPALALLLFLWVALLAAGLGNGYGWSTLFCTGSDGDLPDLAGLGAGAGVPLSIFAFIAWAPRAPRRPGISPFLGPMAFWLGAGAGTLLAAQRLDKLGLAIAGIAFFAVAASAALTGMAAARSRRRARARREETLRSGLRTTATVSDKGYVRFHESDRIFTKVTFTFVDTQSVQRWVQRPMVILYENPIVDGQTTDLWYDPADPGNDAKIVVKLAIDAPPLMV